MGCSHLIVCLLPCLCHQTQGAGTCSLLCVCFFLNHDHISADVPVLLLQASMLPVKNNRVVMNDDTQLVEPCSSVYGLILVPSGAGGTSKTGMCSLIISC